MNYCPNCGSKLQPKEMEEVSRLACLADNCGFVYWNNPVPVVAALVRHDGKYIVARNAQWPKGVFSLITGYLEENETPEQAMKSNNQDDSCSGRRRRIGIKWEY